MDSLSHDVVIKASGLAAGKGVILPPTKEEAKTALKEIMLDHVFGSSGRSCSEVANAQAMKLSLKSFLKAMRSVSSLSAMDTLSYPYLPPRITSESLMETRVQTQVEWGVTLPHPLQHHKSWRRYERKPYNRPSMECEGMVICNYIKILII